MDYKLWLNVGYDKDANSTFCVYQVTNHAIVEGHYVETLLKEERAEYLWDVGHALSVASFVRKAVANYTRRAYPDQPF